MMECSRRDGSPFVNLLMMAPLCDSRGKIRYFIGAQVDVSGLVKDCTDMESLQRLLEDQEGHGIHENGPQNDDSSGTNGINGHVDDFRTGPGDEEEDEFRNLSEMFNLGELSTVRRYGGRMHTDKPIEDSEAGSIHKPRLLLRDSSPVQTLGGDSNFAGLPGPRPPGRLSGKLSGVYKHVSLLISILGRCADYYCSTSLSDHTHPFVSFSHLHLSESLECYSHSFSLVSAVLPMFVKNLKQLLPKVEASQLRSSGSRVSVPMLHEPPERAVYLTAG